MDIQEFKNKLLKGNFSRAEIVNLIKENKINILDVIDLLKEFAKKLNIIKDLLN